MLLHGQLAGTGQQLVHEELAVIRRTAQHHNLSGSFSTSMQNWWLHTSYCQLQHTSNNTTPFSLNCWTVATHSTSHLQGIVWLHCGLMHDLIT